MKTGTQHWNLIARRDYDPDLLKRLRESRQLTQGQLAAAVGVHRLSINYSENRGMGLRTLRALAGYYGCSMDALLYPANERVFLPPIVNTA